MAPFPPPPPAGPTPAIGWQELPGSPEPAVGGRHDDAFFLDADLGWLVNTDGRIYRTRDGGESWELLLDDPAISFRSIGFADAQLGWAGNLNGFNNPAPGLSLFETRDGGETWTNVTDRVSGPEPVGICGIWVVDDRTAYAAGRWNGPGVFLRTRDGGATWQSFDLAPLVTGLVDVYFFDSDRGLLIGGNGVGNTPSEQAGSRTVILLTEDGGDTWEIVHESELAGTWGWKVSFPTATIGYAAVQGPAGEGIVLKTADAGRTWSELEVAENTGFSGIGFATSELGWVGAGAETYETRDGGETWNLVALGSQLNRFRMMTPALGYASGAAVYRFGGVP